MLSIARKANGKVAQSVETGSLPSSTLGTALALKGVIDASGELIVHATIEGRINADRLVLGPDCFVRGDIVANDVRIAGCLVGRIFALNVTVEETADINGRIFHHTLSVARGARIDARMPWRPLNFFEQLDQLPETQP